MESVIRLSAIEESGMFSTSTGLYRRLDNIDLRAMLPILFNQRENGRVGEKIAEVRVEVQVSRQRIANADDIDGRRAQVKKIGRR